MTWHYKKAITFFAGKFRVCMIKLVNLLNIWYCFMTLQARLWVQVIRELRNGVKLKKVDSSYHGRDPPIEYELTPYEILMDDIRSRRYKLNKVMVDGTLPPRVKKDAHAVILDFIRSRPPLKRVRFLFFDKVFFIVIIMSFFKN